MGTRVEQFYTKSQIKIFTFNACVKIDAQWCISQRILPLFICQREKNANFTCFYSIYSDTLRE